MTTIDLERPVGTEIRAKRAPKKAGSHANAVTHTTRAASPTKTRGRAMPDTHLKELPPASGSPIPDAAICRPQPSLGAPHQDYPTADDLPRYAPDPTLTPIIDDIVSLHRERQANIKAKTKLILQAKALLRSSLCTDADYEDDDAKANEVTIHGDKRRKLTKAAGKRVDDAMKEAANGEGPFAITVAPYLGGLGLFEARQSDLERTMVRLAKQLPAYQWVKTVKGLGDVSFATLVGECGDIGSYKSVAAVWKRLGLAVIDGKRQGSPGAGATADDWIAHGYNRARRSVSWNARGGLILGMGLWRPSYGAALDDVTEYQRVFAERARCECGKLGVPVKEAINAKGEHKESYTKHVINRAMRYTEKRMIKHLYLAWRRGGAL